MRVKNRRRLYKLAIFIGAALIAFSFAAFSDMREVSDRSIVTGMGIDSGADGGITVTAHVLVPSSDENKKFKQETAVCEGNDLFDALSKFSVSQGRKVEFSQCGLVVFGRPFTEKGILTEVKGMFNAGTVSPGVVMIAADTTASGFLNSANGLGEETSEKLGKFLTRFQHTSAMPMSSLISYLSDECGESNASFLPSVKIVGADGKAGAEGKPDEKKAELAPVFTAAVFKNGKRVGELTEDETNGLTMSLKDSKKGSYRLANFTYGGKDYGAVYGHILRKKAKITAGFTKDGRPLIKYGIDMRIDVKTQSAFMEYYGEKDNYKLRNAVAAALSNQIKRNIASANDTAKTLNADFFNHRYRFYRTCPKKIKAFEKNSEGSFLDNLVIESAVNIDAD